MLQQLLQKQQQRLDDDEDASKNNSATTTPKCKGSRKMQPDKTTATDFFLHNMETRTRKKKKR
jgi:hypothetical protein